MTMCRASLRRKSCVARCCFAGKVEPSQREEMARLGSRREIRFVEQARLRRQRPSRVQVESRERYEERRERGRRQGAG
jgi:hypothetical protein